SHRRLLACASRSQLWNLEVVVNHNAVVTHGHASVLDFLAVAVKAGGSKVYVVSLPREGRKTGVYAGLVDRINAAAFVVFAVQTKRTKNLDLVGALNVQAAVASSLSGGGRHERRAKLQVQRHVAKALLALHADHQQPIVGHLAAVEVVGRGAVK